MGFLASSQVPVRHPTLGDLLSFMILSHIMNVSPHLALHLQTFIIAFETLHAQTPCYKNGFEKQYHQ